MKEYFAGPIHASRKLLSQGKALRYPPLLPCHESPFWCHEGNGIAPKVDVYNVISGPLDDSIEPFMTLVCTAFPPPLVWPQSNPKTMNTKTLLALFIGIIMIACSGNAHSDPETNQAIASPSGEDQEVKAAADALIDFYEETGNFMGLVMVAKDGKPVYTRTVGYANLDQKKPNLTETPFRLGSIVKSYMDVIILRLYERGELSMDDKVGDHLDGFSDDIAKKVTIKHLINHTSGLGDVFDIPEYMDNPRKFKSIQDVLPLLQQSKLLFKPGSDERYSNYGYNVLGAIAEKITGKSFETLMQDEVYTPAGLSNTFLKMPEDIPGAARCYRYTLNGSFEDYTDQLEFPRPDCGLVATADDLLKFFHTLHYTETLVSHATKHYRITGFNKKGNAAGWAKVIENRENVLGSAGGGPGVSATYEHAFGDNLTVIVLANTDQDIAEAIAGRLLAQLRGDDSPPPIKPVVQYFYGHYKELGRDGLQEQFETLNKANHGVMNPLYLNMTGYACLQEGLTREAEDFFRINANLFPEDANCWDSLGEVLVTCDKKDEAITCFRKALEIDPNFGPSKRWLVELGAE